MDFSVVVCWVMTGASKCWFFFYLPVRLLGVCVSMCVQSYSSWLSNRNHKMLQRFKCDYDTVYKNTIVYVSIHYKHTFENSCVLYAHANTRGKASFTWASTFFSGEENIEKEHRFVECATLRKKEIEQASEQEKDGRRENAREKP